MPVLVLWDVDHTLVDNAGISKETYAAAFQALAGVPPVHPARTSGRTDRLIMRELFESHGLAFPRWLDVYAALEAAGRQRLAAMRERGTVLPGVRDALAQLSRTPAVIQSVLTGNVLPNAQMKIVALDLADALDFAIGAYGLDSDDRADLVAIAQQRASKKQGTVFDRANTVLIVTLPGTSTRPAAVELRSSQSPPVGIPQANSAPQAGRRSCPTSSTPSASWPRSSGLAGRGGLGGDGTTGGRRGCPRRLQKSRYDRSSVQRPAVISAE